MSLLLQPRRAEVLLELPGGSLHFGGALSPGLQLQLLPVLRGGPGASNYEIWLSLGNVGSEQDFLDTLKSTVPGPQAQGTEYLDILYWLGSA